jgi:hypothetical protein
VGSEGACRFAVRTKAGVVVIGEAPVTGRVGSKPTCVASCSTSWKHAENTQLDQVIKLPNLRKFGPHAEVEEAAADAPAARCHRPGNGLRAPRPAATEARTLS